MVTNGLFLTEKTLFFHIKVMLTNLRNPIYALKTYLKSFRAFVFRLSAIQPTRSTSSYTSRKENYSKKQKRHSDVVFQTLICPFKTDMSSLLDGLW